MELEPLEPAPATSFRPAVDRRPRMPEPLPVKLVAVADVRLLSAAGLERRLDAFYVGLFGFERSPDESDRHGTARNRSEERRPLRPGGGTGARCRRAGAGRRARSR